MRIVERFTAFDSSANCCGSSPGFVASCVLSERGACVSEGGRADEDNIVEGAGFGRG